MTQKIRLGVVGAGRLGGFHADKAVAHPDIELTIIYDSNANQAASVAAKHSVKAAASLDEVFDAVDAVVIATPTVLHHELGLPFLERGKHVLMEKPMTASVREAEELLATAESSGVVFQVGHVEQFNPAWANAEPILGPIRQGEKAIIEARRTSGYTFRSVDVGAVFDLMIHDLDLILSVVSSPVVSVDSLGFRYLGNKENGAHEDAAEAHVKFENGTIATVYASRVEREAVRCMKIRTASGAAEIDFGARKFSMLQPDEAVQTGMFAPNRVDPATIPGIVGTFMPEHFVLTEQTGEAVDALSLEMADFANSILSGTPPQVSGSRAINSVRLAERILKGEG